jgi:hypothetical protein
MIGKNKRYELKCGYDYVLMDIADDVVFGRYLNSERKWCSIQHDLNGVYRVSGGNYNLVEINSPYADWQIDDKILVWDITDNPGVKHTGHFAGLDESGNPMVFKYGLSSHTTDNKYGNQTTSWDFAEKANG